jgi:glycerol kinase
MAETFVLSIDQGTTSTRAIIFDHEGRLAGVSQREHRQYFPHPGWVEHDAAQIWRNTEWVLQQALANQHIEPSQIAAIGITNQRETCVLWDPETGIPLRRAIVWQDTRTQELVEALLSDPGEQFFRERCGIPPATYFTAPRLRWMFERNPELRRRAGAGEVLFGTMETWLIWNLTGGPAGGEHITDVTNASRTMLMNLKGLHWDPDLLSLFDVPEAMLPRIVPSGGESWPAVKVLPGVPIAGVLGDQQAALFGQTCFDQGEAKCTYGTGAFLLLNTGTELVHSTNGMLTTVAFRLGKEAPIYALEGSIAVAGSLVQWFRDSLGLIRSAPEIETLASSVDDNGGCYIVPAFAGLFAPHWRGEARGVIAGLTAYVTKAHLARAILEATAWQTFDVVQAMNADSGIPLRTLKVDGGMTANNLLMQSIADVLDATVVRPMVSETVSLGAAYMAGLTVGYWADIEGLRRRWHRAGQWDPTLSPDERAQQHRMWRAAVERTLDWPTGL